jgi:hypothetical protein
MSSVCTGYTLPSVAGLPTTAKSFAARYAISSDGNSDWFSVRISVIDSVLVGNETCDSKQALHVGHSQM